MKQGYKYQFYKAPISTFGSLMENRSFEGDTLGYKFGFNGKENDDEISGQGNTIAFEERIYDSRLGRFFSTDPLEVKYPYQSTYCFASNNPITLIDHLGMGSSDPVKHTTGKNQTLWDVSKDYYKQNKNEIGTTWGKYWSNVLKWNKGGNYGKVGGTMMLSDPEKATYGENSEINVPAGGTVKIVEYQSSTSDAVGNDHPVPLGLDIEIGFKDDISGFSNFNWIQNITREGWFGSPTPLQYIDPLNRHLQYPFYYSNNDYRDGKPVNLSQTPLFNAYFIDGPVKPAKNFGNTNNKYSYQKFYAELTLVAKDKGGVYRPLLTITYGFETSQINGKAGYKKYPIRMQQPSDFQKIVIQNLNESR